VHHDQIWAPWRLAYIRGDTSKQTPPEPALKLLDDANDECFLCHAVADTNDRENLVIHRGKHCLTVLNRYPYNNGHLLVAPQQHQGQPDELSDEETLELQQTIQRMIGLMRQLLGADGFNIGLNLGRAAGAGLPGHLHWHIVPRWNGDTNFMPVMAGVDVISQSLDALWEALDEAIRGE